LAVLTRPTDSSPLSTGHRIVRLLQRGQQPARVDDEVLARSGQRHLAPLTLEQRQAELRLQFLDLHGHRWRREVQGLGGAGKAHALGHLAEHAQLAEGGIQHWASGVQ
jgi:hypothetical protein